MQPPPPPPPPPLPPPPPQLQPTFLTGSSGAAEPDEFEMLGRVLASVPTIKSELSEQELGALRMLRGGPALGRVFEALLAFEAHKDKTRYAAAVRAALAA
jgi:hypothetical protein